MYSMNSFGWIWSQISDNLEPTSTNRNDSNFGNNVENKQIEHERYDSTTRVGGSSNFMNVVYEIIEDINVKIKRFNENCKLDFCHQKQLDVNIIKEYMQEHQYDNTCVSLIQREMFIQQFTDLCNDVSMETINLFYNQLIQKITFIKQDYKRFYFQSGADIQRDDIVFIWNRNMNDIQLTDGNHFLYICSLIINKWNEEIKLSKDILLNHQSILLYLDYIEMNGLLFKSISPKVFKQSIKTRMINITSDDQKVITKITQTATKYASLFYDKIKHFPTSSIQL
eukprot:18919_1